MTGAVAYLRPSPPRKLAYLELPGSPVRKFFLYNPSTCRSGAPIMVSVHGIARNAAAYASNLLNESERFGVPILAPYFSKQDYGQYQQIEDRRSGVRSDVALIEMIEEVSQITGAEGSRVLLFGYSGGAQFAHRFAMAYPDRVASVALGSAGWYTMPDAGAAYPAGLDTQGWSFERPLDPLKFLRVPFHVSVGDLDVTRDDALRKGKRLDDVQGMTRLERAFRWTSHMKERGRDVLRSVPPTMRVLPAVGHDFVASVERGGLAAWAFNCFERDAALTPCVE